MKSLFFNLVLFFCCTFLIQAQNQTLFIDKDYNTVIKESKITQKPLVVFFYAKWCTHCNKMKSEVFIDNEVVKLYQTNYSCVAVDVESEAGIALKNKFESVFKVKSYPTFAILDSDENLLYASSGELKKEGFIKMGKELLNPENHYKKIKEDFYADISDPINCLKFITVHKKAGFDVTPITRKYLETQTEKQLFTELNWRILSNGITDIEAKEIQFISANKDNFAKVSSEKRVERKLFFVTSENLKPSLELLDTVGYYKKRSIAEKFGYRSVDSLLFRYDLILYEHTNNWKKYEEIAVATADKFLQSDSKTLIEIATNFVQHTSNKIAIQKATNWIKQSLLLEENSEKYKILSKLYFKTEDYKSALIYAQKGKDFASKMGWKTEEFDVIISEIKLVKK